MPITQTQAAYQQILSMAVEDRSSGYQDLVSNNNALLAVLRRKGAKKHDWFAGVQPVDGAVKFNFLPMHENPEILDGSSAGLRRHKTGASVFRFTEIDENLAGELETVVAKGFLDYMKRE